jgi:hypothetical protein
MQHKLCENKHNLFLKSELGKKKLSIKYIASTSKADMAAKRLKLSP